MISIRKTGSLFLWVLAIFSLSCLNNSVEASHLHHHRLQSIEVPINPQHRTAYHFQPKAHWINDPNGPMYYNGYYHLFYQYNPKGAVWGNIVWAHSVSKDLINWTPLENAIYPSKPFDIKGCWSGSAMILPNGIPAIFYTGIDAEERQLQNIAYPKDLNDPFLREWVKPDYNPIIYPSPFVNASAFRDPTTAWKGRDGLWRTIIGTKKDLLGFAALYKTKDFINWMETMEPLHSSPGTGMWECPDFFPVALKGKYGLDFTYNGDEAAVKYVLKISLDLNRYEYYTMGKYDQNKDIYTPDGIYDDNKNGLRYDYGKFYASKSFYDPVMARRILWGWINESDSVQNDVAKGWSGVQAIPRTILMARNRRQLVQWPVQELETLRRNKVEIVKTELRRGHVLEIRGVTAAQADVEVSFKVPKLERAEDFDPKWGNAQSICSQKGAYSSGGIGPFGLLVMASDDLVESTAIFFRIFKNKDKPVVVMCSDQSRSSLNNTVDKTTYGSFVDVDLKYNIITLRTLVDHSIIESFGSHGLACITARVYPTKACAGDSRIYAFNNGRRPVRITRLSAWSMETAKIN